MAKITKEKNSFKTKYENLKDSQSQINDVEIQAHFNTLKNKVDFLEAQLEKKNQQIKGL